VRDRRARARVSCVCVCLGRMVSHVICRLCLCELDVRCYSHYCTLLTCSSYRTCCQAAPAAYSSACTCACSTTGDTAAPAGGIIIIISSSSSCVCFTTGGGDTPYCARCVCIYALLLLCAFIGGTCARVCLYMYVCVHCFFNRPAVYFLVWHSPVCRIHVSSPAAYVYLLIDSVACGARCCQRCCTE